MPVAGYKGMVFLRMWPGRTGPKSMNLLAKSFPGRKVISGDPGRMIHPSRKMGQAVISVTPAEKNLIW